MTKDNLITAPENITLDKAETILQQYKTEKAPIVNKRKTHRVGNIQRHSEKEK